MDQTEPQELYIRQGEDIVMAPETDMAVARGYQQWIDKGEPLEGRRITIMAERKTYQTGEEIHIIHAMEASGQGMDVYVMGPKEITDEYLDGKLTGTVLPAGHHPFIPLEYNGIVVKSPWVDFNYDITIYSFDEPGRYKILWQPSKWKSNVLEIIVK